MFVNIKTKGFVLKERDFGEADKVFTIFTQDFGKINVTGKAIRKITAKLRSGIEIFSVSDIEFVEGKKKTLTDAVLLTQHKNVTRIPEKFVLGKKIGKVLDAFIKGPEHDHEIFNLIIDIFDKLDKLQVLGFELQVLFIYFIWNFFTVLGYAPELSSCAHCHNKLNENELYFSNKEGGVICKNCSTVKKEFKKIDVSVIKILRIILKKDWDMLVKLKIKSENLKILKEISKNYYLYLLSSHSFSKKFV